MTTDEQIQQSLLLDKEWERQQIRSFTAWINFQLKKAGLKIDDIFTDLRDGRMFLRLLESISGESLPPPERKNHRVHQINNVNRCLEFIAKKGVRLAGIGSEEIVDGNKKMTLGTIWVIILRFAIQDASDIKSHDGLFLWVKKKTDGYRAVNVQNWTSSFQDGLAFNALIHRHRPDLLDYDKLKKDNAVDNLNQAFEIAETHLGIPRMLDADDIQIAPDQKSIMTYISAFYQVFSKSQVADNSARRIRRVLDTNSDNAKKIQEYERIASELLAWIRAKTGHFGDKSFEKEPLEKLYDELTAMNKFRQDEKPPKAKEKALLDNLASTIRTRMYLQKRLDYVPIEGHSIHDVQMAWNDLNRHEKLRLERLHSLIQQLLYADQIFKKFLYKCEQQDLWMSGRTDALSVDVSKMLLPELQSTKRMLAGLRTDMEAREPRIRLISGLHDKLRELESHDLSKADARHSDVLAASDSLKSAHQNLSQQVEQREKVLLGLESLMMAYAQKASEIRGDLDVALEDLNDTYQVQSVKEIEALREELDAFMKVASDNRTKIEECKSLEAQIVLISDAGSPYSTITVSELETKLGLVDKAAEARKAALQSEEANQDRNEALRKQFAQLAAFIDEFRVAAVERVQEAPTKASSLEDHKQSLEKVSQDVDSFYRDKLVELESLSAKLQEFQVFHNPHTSHTQESLNADYNALFDLQSTSVTEVENQLILRDESSITEQQVKEYRKSFDYFDKERNGFLPPPLFRNFLVSLAFNVPEAEEDSPSEREFQRILSKVDTSCLGKIYFNDFLNFMAVETKDTDSADQIIESFRALAGGKDYIMPAVIHQHLSDKAQDIIPHMTPSTSPDAPAGALDFTSFASAIYGESDL